MSAHSALIVRNGEKVNLADLRLVDFEEFRGTILSAVESGARLSALFGALPSRSGLQLLAVLAKDAAGARIERSRHHVDREAFRLTLL